MRRTLLRSMRLTVGSLAALALTASGFAGAADAAAVGASAPPAGATAAVRHVAHPTRILCLSASATQMLYAIGAGRQVAGVDKYSTYPASAPRTSFTGFESSAEDYLPERPDLVVLAYDENNMVSQLAALHIATIVLPPATSITQIDHQLVELGKVTGHLAGATREVTALGAQLASVAKSVAGRARGRTYYVEIDPTLYTATSKTFVGALFSRLGMRNIADPAGHGSDFPQLSAEYLLKANPDYVFLADTVCCGQRPATFAARPGFSVLRAVREHHVVGVSDTLASEWGPHTLVQLFRIIARTVTSGSRT